jgi:hypothetical protein
MDLAVVGPCCGICTAAGGFWSTNGTDVMCVILFCHECSKYAPSMRVLVLRCPMPALDGRRLRVLVVPFVTEDVILLGGVLLMLW